ncbi:MAG: hypothetical protein ACYCOU_05750 [Sulfobacillus sp.]
MKPGPPWVLPYRTRICPLFIYAAYGSANQRKDDRPVLGGKLERTAKRPRQTILFQGFDLTPNQMRLLVHRGIDPNHRDVNGRLALTHYIHQTEHVAVGNWREKVDTLLGLTDIDRMMAEEKVCWIM